MSRQSNVFELFLFTDVCLFAAYLVLIVAVIQAALYGEQSASSCQ